MTTTQQPTSTAPANDRATYRIGDKVNIITMYAGGERETFTIEAILSHYEVRIAGLRRPRMTRELAHAA
jgi:hypothetical protein